MSIDATEPIELWKGESRTLTVTVVDPDTGFPVDLSSVDWLIAAIEFQVKADVETADPPAIAKSIGSGITLLAQTGDTLGQAEIELEPADTSTLTAGQYKYDVVAVFDDGRRTYVIKPSYLTLNGVVNQL